MKSLTKYNLTEPIYIDANIFVYHFVAGSPYHGHCTEFLKKIEEAKIKGVISGLIIDEVIYALLISAGCSLLGSNIVREVIAELKSDKDFFLSCFKETECFSQVLENLKDTSLDIIEVNYDLMRNSIEIMKRFQLLPRDAIHVAVCEAFNIRNVATLDKDFEKVKHLNIWSPL